MKKVILLCLVVILAAILLISSIVQRGNTIVEESVLSDVELARNDVVEKWRSAAGEIGTSRFIEDIYKQYPSDLVISNIYYYVIAYESYDHYENLGDEKYLSQAIEYAEKIDEDYSGALSSDIHEFVDRITPDGISEEEHKAAEEKEETYTSLTNSDQKAICTYIQGRYDYYDLLEGGYSGDKYSDIIMEEAAEKYGLTSRQAFIIWMNAYQY